MTYPAPPVRDAFLLRWAVATCLLTAPRWAQAAPETLHVVGVDVQRTEGGRDVRIHTDGVPNYTLFRLSDPMRVVLDVAGGDVSAIRGPLTVEDGMIAHVAVRQYQGEARPIGRIIISFEQDAGYDVRTAGQDIIVHAQRAGVPLPDVSFAPQPEATAEPEAPATQATQATQVDSAPVPAPQSVSNAPTQPPNPAPAVRDEAASLAPATPQHPAPLSQTAPTLPPTGSRARLHRIEHHDAGVLLRFDRTPAYATQMLDNPARLVVDLAQTTRTQRARAPKRTAWAHRVRMAQHPTGLRMVFDLKAGHAAQVMPSRQGLWVKPQRAVQAEAADAPGATAQAQGPQTQPQAELQARAQPQPQAQARGQARPEALGAALLKDVQVHTSVINNRAVATLHLVTPQAKKPKVDTSNARAWVLELDDVTLAPKLERTIDLSASVGAVTMVSVFMAQRTPPKVHVVINLAERASPTLERVEDGWLFGIQTEGEAIEAHIAAPKVAAFVADAPAIENKPATTIPKAATKRISIDVKDADIINVLRLISEETGENIIASDEVRGKVSLKLRNVPADQALDTMLRTKGFDRVRHNNILRIASAEAIQKEREQDMARRKAQTEMEDTFIKMVTINYATASEVVDQLKPMLTPRGSVQVDGRTNTLIMQDVASNIDRLVELARRLDKQTPLVNIQARIVEAQSNFERDLGVQWGGATQHTARTGNPTGVYFPSDVSVNGAADAGTTNQGVGVTAPSRYAVNLPAALKGQGGGLGFILGSAGGSQMLDLRLTAMENNGSGKVISSPEVSTLDNKTARISQGVEIPVSTVSAAGTNIRYVPAVLELEVTPHVTNDGTVLLRIKVQKSQLDYVQKSAAGDPGIQKKQAETEVLVRDGDTSVIGGIYTRDTSDSYAEVPFLARIPLLGYLFREHRNQDNRSELLVFITPRIINRNESVVQAGSVLEGTKTAATPK